MWAMIGKVRVAQIRDISLKLRLFQSVVVPIMDYCSAVWCPGLLRACSNHDRIFENSMQKVQNIFLRQLGHLRQTTTSSVLHREFCVEPVASMWMRSLVQLWQRLQQAPTGSLLGRVARASLHMAQRGTASVKKRCWAGQFMDMIKSFAKNGRDGQGRPLHTFANQYGWTAPSSGHCVHVHEKLLELPFCPFWGAWHSLVNAPWLQDLPLHPRSVHEHGSYSIKDTTYHRWFALPLPTQVFRWDTQEGRPRMPVNMPAYVQTTRGIPFDQLKQLIRFRTGAHHLAIETGRWQKKARSLRVCTKCTNGCVEDELHLLFECPAYSHLRRHFAPSLFTLYGGIDATGQAVLSDPSAFCQFMEQDPRSVAAFVSACLELRREEVAPARSVGYGTANSSSSLLQETQEYCSAYSDFSGSDDEVTGRPMEPGVATERASP